MGTPILSEQPAAGNAANLLLLDHALAYCNRGWSMIPVRGKRASDLWKNFQTQPADEMTLRRLFAKSDITGLAVITGKVSGGLAIRDFDQADAYHAWTQAHPDDAATVPTVQTQRGYHLYGTLPEEKFIDLGDGELRADSGHYCLIPPSRHPDGATYSWVIPLPPAGTPLPLLPASLLTKAEQQTQDTPDKAVNPLHGLHIPPTDSEIAAAINQTLPTATGQRNRRLFDLARILKGLQPDATPDELRSVVKEWFALALPTIATKDWSTSWSDFTFAWQNVKHPAGQSFRRAATEAAGAVPPIPSDLGYEGHLLQLAALCWRLQAQSGDKPFPLGCEKAGKALGFSYVTAWRLFKTLQFDRVIVRVKKGTKAHGKVPGKASEWRFIQEQIGDLTS